MGGSELRSAGIQTSQSEPAPTSIPGGTQTTPTASPRRHTITGGTQTTPPHQKQDLQDHNCTSKDPQTHNMEGRGKGKKSSEKKPS